MASRQDELEIFKTQINLSEYAASVGYQINAKKTYQGGAEGGGSTVMRSASDPTDVIVIGKDTDSHWIYWHVSVGKGSLASDAGSIIDFLQNRRGGKDAFPLGLVRQELRPWVNGSVRTRPAKSAFVSDLRPDISPQQEPLIKSAMELMPEGGKIILAFDHDAGADSLAARIKALFSDLRGARLELIDDRPPTPGDDWNDVLRASIAERTPIPGRNPEP
jgi:hypothetical protein